MCRAAAKDESKPEERVRPLVCDALERADGVAITEMAKAKCVHPDRPVAKLCKDCPASERKTSASARTHSRAIQLNIASFFDTHTRTIR